MEIIKILNKKNNSSVKLVKINRTEYIIKNYYQISKHFLIELNILSTVKHPNVLSMIRLLSKNNGSIGIILPKEKIDLCSLLEKRKLSIFDKMNYLMQISSGLEYLHYNNIMHLDLKSENIMITNRHAKIIDFGSSEYLFDKKILATTIKCTVTHRPPEAFSGNYNDDRFYIDKSFDIWSLGIIIFEILSNKPLYLHYFVPKYLPDDNPLYETKYNQQMFEFIKSDIFQKKIINFLPESLRSTLNFDPKIRPKIGEIIHHLKKMTPKNLKFNYQNINNQYPIRTMSIRLINSKIKGLTYYNRLINTVSKKYSKEFTSYPKIIIYATFDLIYRINLCWYPNEINQELINQIILMVNLFFNSNRYHIPWKIILQTTIQDEIINKIILSMNGILFQYSFYQNLID